MLDQLILESLLQVDALLAGLRQSFDGLYSEVDAVRIVENRHTKGGGSAQAHHKMRELSNFGVWICLKLSKSIFKDSHRLTFRFAN